MTAAPRYSFADVKAELLRRLPSLVRELAPEGASKGGYWIAKNPTRADRHAGSFWIRLNGSAAGVWKEEAGGEGGDVINLIAYVLGHTDRKDTYAWCLAWLGWGPSTGSGSGPSAAELEARRQAHAAERARLEAAERKAKATNAAKARSWWLHAEADLAGTPVQKYLERRGLPLSAFRRLPGALRYQPAGEWVDRHGEVHERPHTMLAAMVDGAGEIRAVHRTYLTADGEKLARADSGAAKMIWPSFAGLVIRLGRAKGAWTPERAAAKGLTFPLLLSEGIEDGLTGHLASPDAFAWAAGSLGNMGNVPLLACFSRIVILGQNDEGPAAEQFGKVLRRLRDRGAPPILVARSWVGKDANDLLMGAA